MPIFDLFSKRKKHIENINEPEVYQYDELPSFFRRQVVYLWHAAIGVYKLDWKISLPPGNRELHTIPKANYDLWKEIHNILATEIEKFEPSSEDPQHPYLKCEKFFLAEDTPIDHLLDLIELTFLAIDKIVRAELEKPSNHRELKISQSPDDAINNLNHRFRKHGIGYQFEGGQIIRVDSKFIHAEVVVPALGLLSDSNFAGPEQEFCSAHEHYRRQEYKDAIVDALNSFESTIKSICDVRGWSYSKTATAKDLINVILTNQLIPQYLENHFFGLRQVLEAGVPTVRNKTSGHGQGAIPTNVPEYLASYVLHLTASNIVMLVEAHKALP